MNNRFFLNPQDGEIYPESWYHQQNIDLACAIEAVTIEGGLAFDIVHENLERMEFADVAVISLIADFARTLAIRAMETDDAEEAAECGSVAAYVSRIMMDKLSNAPMTKH